MKNLNYQITGEDLYDLFGRYGTIRQIRIGTEQKSKGTAFVVFDDVMDVSTYITSFIGNALMRRLGKERTRSSEWLSFAGEIHRRTLPHACEARRGRR